MISALFALLLAPQDDARALVEKLRSDSVDERDEATDKLKALGKAALPELEKAAKSTDAEATIRARQVIRYIGVSERLSPGLLKKRPGLAERLASGNDHTWTEVFLELAGDRGERDAVPCADLECLAAPALRAAASDEERHNACATISRLNLISAAPEMTKLLKDSERNIRVLAAETLGRWRARDAMPAVSELLRDPEAYVRARVAVVLGEWGGAEAILKECRADLIALLEVEDSHVCGPAAWALGLAGAREAVPRIKALLKHPDDIVRLYAQKALARLDPKEAVSYWAAALRANTKASDAIRILIHLQALGAKEELVAALEHTDVQIRRNAASMLGSMEAVDAVPALMKLLGDPQVKTSAARALGELRAREAIPAIMKLLEDESRPARSAAAEALGLLAAREAIPRLVELLGDGAFEVRMGAVRGLRLLGAREASPRIVPLLKDPNWLVRSNASGTLQAWRAREVIPALLEAAQQDDSQAAIAACEALVELSAKEAVPHLERLLEDKNPIVRGQAARGLGGLGSREKISRIVVLLKDDHPNAREYAAHGLSELGTKEEAPKIAELLNDPSDQVRWIAAQALERLGAKEYAPHIALLIQDPSPQVRMAAIPVLARLQGRDAIPALVRELERKDRATELTAATWLCTLGVREGVPTVLQDEKQLFFLNALRSPEAWARLNGAKITGDPYGTRRDVFKALAAQAGLKVEWPSTAADDPWPAHWWLVYKQERASLSQALGRTLDDPHRKTPYAAILEDERIRIVTRNDALNYWRAWWEEDRRK